MLLTVVWGLLMTAEGIDEAGRTITESVLVI